MFISIIRKSFLKISTKFSILLNYILYFDHLKTSFRVNKFRPTISTKEMFHKRFFPVEVLDLCNRLHDYQDYCFISISVLKYRNYSKFYQILLLLSGDISLNPGPRPNKVFQSFWKPFENKGHFFHLTINSINTH